MKNYIKVKDENKEKSKKKGAHQKVLSFSLNHVCMHMISNQMKMESRK